MIFLMTLYSKLLLTLLLLIILFVLLVKFRKILLCLLQILIQRNMIHSKYLSAKSPKCTKTDKFRQFLFLIHCNLTIVLMLRPNNGLFTINYTLQWITYWAAISFSLKDRNSIKFGGYVAHH